VQQAHAQVQQSTEAAEAGERLARNSRDDFRAGQKVKLDDVLTNEVLAGQARGSLNEARYQYALALATLERATGGAFCSGLVGGTSAAPAASR
jgi:outer membrane protein TolC